MRRPSEHAYWPRFHAYCTTTTSVPNYVGSFTTLPMTTTVHDSGDGLGSAIVPTGSPYGFTIPTSGVWIFSLGASFAVDSSDGTFKSAWLDVNGTGQFCTGGAVDGMAAAGYGTVTSGSRMLTMVAGDVVKAVVAQNSGASVNCLSGQYTFISGVYFNSP